MTSALFKKQLLESFSWILQNKKTGKKRTKRQLTLYVVLYVVIFALLGVMFFFLSLSMCEPLIDAGFPWLFFALMSLIAITLGVFASIFTAHASIYRAKDNDLLLAMPIPPRKILAARLSGIYALGFLYELIVIVPAIAAYFINAKLNAAAVIFTLIIPFILSFLTLTLSCILGWIVAAAGSRLKNNKIITVVISMVFILIYYYFCGNVYSIIENIVSNPAAVGAAFKGVLFPLYHMGMATCGSVPSMLIFCAFTTVIFLVVYFILSRSFLKLSTVSSGTSKKKYVEKKVKNSSAAGALLRRELRRFLGSTSYMLNCGLGVFFMIVIAVLLLIESETASELLSVIPPEYDGLIALAASAVICAISTMIDITSPSVSLEGKNIWLIQSLPVSGYQALKAKLNLHLLFALIPAAILIISIVIVLKPSPLYALLLAASSVLFIMMTALIGLILNLKSPNLTWTNEAVPIRQSMSVVVSLFGGWAIILVLGVIYFLLRNILSPVVYLSILTVLFLAAYIFMMRWLKNTGSSLFEKLQ